MKLYTQLLHRFNNTLIQRRLLNPEQRVLIAVSGGQDSMSLLKLSYQLQPKWNWTLAIIHCDHGWHDSSYTIASYVAQLALHLKLESYQSINTQSSSFSIYSLSLKHVFSALLRSKIALKLHLLDSKFAYEIKKGVRCNIYNDNAIKHSEVIARNWRYHSMYQIGIEHGFYNIITGHNATDRNETFIYNMFRGSGSIGLQALHWQRTLKDKHKLVINSCKKHKENISIIHLIRPFLDITRTELLALCIEAKIPVWPDPSNSILNRPRNQIRSKLLPYLRFAFSSNIDKNIARCAEIIHSETTYLEKLCAHISSIISIENRLEKGKCTRWPILARLSLLLLRALAPTLQRRILKEFFAKYTSKTLSWFQIEQLRLLAYNHNNIKKKKPTTLFYKASDQWIILPNYNIIQVTGYVLIIRKICK